MTTTAVIGVVTILVGRLGPEGTMGALAMAMWAWLAVDPTEAA